jgi:hypothetical protein
MPYSSSQTQNSLRRSRGGGNEKTLNLLGKKTKKSSALKVPRRCPFVLQKMAGRGHGRASGGNEDGAMVTAVFEDLAGEMGGFYLLSLA